MSFVDRSRTEPHSRFVFSALPPDNILCLTLLFCQWQFYKYISFFIQICPPGGGAINAINTSLSFQDVTSSTSPNLNIGLYYYKVWKNGIFAIFSINFQVTGTIASGASIVTGLPYPKALVFGSITRGADGVSTRIGVSTDGKLYCEDGDLQAGWYNGFIAYPI